jgi:hypothetical protein
MVAPGEHNRPGGAPDGPGGHCAICEHHQLERCCQCGEQLPELEDVADVAASSPAPPWYPRRGDPIEFELPASPQVIRQGRFLGRSSDGIWLNRPDVGEWSLVQTPGDYLMVVPRELLRPSSTVCGARLRDTDVVCDARAGHADDVAASLVLHRHVDEAGSVLWRDLG